LKCVKIRDLVAVRCQHSRQQKTQVRLIIYDYYFYRICVHDVYKYLH
jgi:hypothetical protein